VQPTDQMAVSVTSRSVRFSFGSVRADLSPQDLKFCRCPGWQQDRCVALDGKAENATHIEALGTRRGDPADQFRRYRSAATLGPAIEDRLLLCGVPGHHDIGEQAQRVGDDLHFILALGLIAGNAAGVDQTLQRIGRFAAIEHAQQFTSECWVHEITCQEHRPQ